jgi:hypothetical protein
MSQNGTEQPIMIGQTGPLNGQRWLLDKIMSIGREPQVDIVIPDRQVSRFHARITPGNNGVLLEDLGSKNGTYVNGHMLSEPVLLGDGDVVQVALVQQFVFLSSDSTMPLDGSSHQLNLERTGRLYLDPRSRRVWVGDKEVLPPLSVPQFSMLQSLYQHRGDVVSRADLIRVIWGEEEAVGVSEQALDALVRRLRDRLSSLDAGHNYLVTVRGHGLRLDNPSD